MFASSSKKPCTLLNFTSYHSLAELVSANEDLLTEIFLRTPIKSLLKFKSVSKHWLSLITNPSFSRTRNPISPSPSGLFIFRNSPPRAKPAYDYIPLGNGQRPLQGSYTDWAGPVHNHGLEPPAPFTSLTFANHVSGIQVSQSCNGLFLCFSSAQRAANKKYYVFNPTTKYFSLLPPIKVKYPRLHLQLYLAHDPSRSHMYKVICVRDYDNLENHFQIELYSPDAGPWRNSGAPFVVDWAQLKNGVFWNGCIHWTSDYGPSLYYDIENELVKQVPIPLGPEDKSIRYFGESRGHLNLIVTYYNGPTPNSAQLHVYEMSRDYSGWFVKYQVDLEHVSIAFPEMNLSSNCLEPWYQFSILSFVREEVDEESYLVLYVPSVAIRYNIKDKTFVKIWDFNVDHFESDIMLHKGWLNSFLYFESLSNV